MVRDCRLAIIEASRDKDGDPTFTKAQAGKLLDEIQLAAEKRTKDGTDIEDAIVAEVTERTLQAKEQGQIQRRNAFINIGLKKELTNKIDNLVAEGLSPKKAFQAILVGVQGNVKEGRYSIDAQHKALHGKLLGGVVKELEENDLLSIVNQKTMSEKIEDELWQLSLKDGIDNVTGSKEAKKIAQILSKYREVARLRQNRLGTQIDRLESYTGTQTHDMQAMTKAGKQAWMERISPLLDQERTYKGADPQEFLDKTYDALSTGVHLKSQGADDGKLFEFKGPGNLAKRISQRRVLHFKDAASARAYRQEFGKSDFMEGVLLDFDRSARNIALMETLGTNPRAMFDTLLDETRIKFRDQPDKIKTLQNTRALRNFYDEVDGTVLIPESPRGAQVGSVLRAIQSMAKLGGALISSFSDIPVKASELQFQGFGILESYGVTLSDIGKGMGSSDRKQLASMLGVGLDGMSGTIASRFTASDDLPGAMSKLMRLFFKLNGLTWWTDSSKIGTGLAMSNRLASFKNKSFNQLDEDTARLFNNFGISADDWDIIRKTASKFEDGNEYIMPEIIQDLPDNLFKSPREKDLLETKLRSYYADRVDFATLTPDARERAILTQGYRRGTIEGEFARTVTQFKSFPVTLLAKVYGRAFYGKGKADIPALMQTVIATTAIGYLAMSAKDVAKGRKPRDPENKETWVAALLQGGGMGIMGDFVFGEYNRFGQDFVTTAAGPTAGTINDLARIYAAAKAGKDPSSKALTTMINNTPFANLFYLRPALNYMFLYQLQEQLNPGYLRRMERRIEKDNNQEFIIKPSQTIR